MSLHISLAENWPRNQYFRLFQSSSYYFCILIFSLPAPLLDQDHLRQWHLKSSGAASKEPHPRTSLIRCQHFGDARTRKTCPLSQRGLRPPTAIYFIAYPGCKARYLATCFPGVPGFWLSATCVPVAAPFIMFYQTGEDTVRAIRT